MNRLMAVIAMTVLLAISGWEQAAAAARADMPEPSLEDETGFERQAEMATIRWVLERKIAAPMARRRAAEKLVTLSDRQLRLIASLCARVAVDGEGPAGGIALLLITVLLIFS